MQGDYAAREKVISCADWLIENANYSGNYAILDYSFPWPMYNMTPPWHSGMAQGLTLQTMILAHKITHDEKYLSYGDLVVKSFYVDVDDGGVTQKTINDGWWYEEYASTHGDNPRVLNGMMYALLGLYDYYAYTGNPDAKDLFDLGVLALEKEIALYDDDGYSYYDILGNPAHKYHPIHIELSHKLYTLTGKEVFLYYSNKWETYDRAYFVVRLLKEPSKLNLAILLFNGTVIFIGLEGLAYLWYIKRGKNQI